MKMPVTFLCFSDRSEWRAWLEEHHAVGKEAWLVHYKKGSGMCSITLEDGVEEALCFGWIDGKLKSLDAESYLLRYSPRRPGSVWCENNKKRVDRLIREGRMTPAGQAKVQAAKESGEWEASAQREDTKGIPPDLEQALCALEGALVAYQALAPSHKKQTLYWIGSAKRQATRRKRIAALLDQIRKTSIKDAHR